MTNTNQIIAAKRALACRIKAAALRDTSGNSHDRPLIDKLLEVAAQWEDLAVDYEASIGKPGAGCYGRA